MKYLLFFIVITIVGGCASKPPDSISEISAQTLELGTVRADIEQFVGSKVRWGGVIHKVENKTAQTWIEIVRRELKENGRPLKGGTSDGRFIASFASFVDPEVYGVGRPLTVVGTIDGQTSRLIGDYDYSFPIVSVKGSHLWAAKSKTPAPAYSPPWGYYSFRFHHPRHHHFHRRFH